MIFWLICLAFVIYVAVGAVVSCWLLSEDIPTENALFAGVGWILVLPIGFSMAAMQVIAERWKERRARAKRVIP